MSVRDKILSIVFGLLVLVVVGAIVYINSYPPPEAKYTEFYVLGAEGKAEGYPREVVAGGEVRVILGVVNRESEKTSYQLVARIDRGENNEIMVIALEQGEKWEQEVSLKAKEVEGKQEIEFLLFKGGEEKPYESLGPFVFDVKAK